MATGYHLATGKVGVASTTCGPGYTQVMTALSTAVQGRVPLVVFAADAPISTRWHNQRSDQAALTKATGAHFLPAHSPDLMVDYVQEAFYIAKFERRPVVISVPHDILNLPTPHRGRYVPSAGLLPTVGPMPPDPLDVEHARQRRSRWLRGTIIVAGRGAIWSGAAPAIEALAEKSGALLGTTLPARGLFDHNPYSKLVWWAVIAGRGCAKEVLGQADCVLSFGASLTYFTTSNGRLFPNATVVQVDQNPRGLHQGRRVADLYVRADATLGARAIAERLAYSHTASASRERPELARAIAERPVDSRHFDVDKGTLDPREAVAALDRLIPKDWDIVGGTGNCSYFYTHMKGRHPRNFHVIREFGAIGSVLSMAMGVAVRARQREGCCVGRRRLHHDAHSGTGFDPAAANQIARRGAE